MFVPCPVISYQHHPDLGHSNPIVSQSNGDDDDINPYMPPQKIQVKIPCLPRFWSVMNMSDTRLENCDLEDQICASHKWDGGHERVGFFSRFCDSAKEHENEACSELLLKQNTFL